MVATIHLDRELLRSGTLLSEETDFKALCSILVEQAQDVSRSDMSALYLYNQQETALRLFKKRGAGTVPDLLRTDGFFIDFMTELAECLVVPDDVTVHFKAALLGSDMRSAFVFPLFARQKKIGFLILNSRQPAHFTGKTIAYLDALSRLAVGSLNNARLYQELKEYLREIEELEKYQESIFGSMTNLLVTLDESGKIEYMNERAAALFNFDPPYVGQDFCALTQDRFSETARDVVQNALKNHEEVLGLQGIYRSTPNDMDFSLNLSPLKGRRGKFEGLVLLLTDQTSEQALKNQVQSAVEDRRVIKDMFSAYLSREVVQDLLDKPELIKMGGDEKIATVFFADIRGYTSFSEGKNPKYIVDVLNAYFGEAVEIVIKYGGYIDKFIGDCIMGVWGVPLVNEKEDALKAVSCALDIQKMVASTKRRFFRGEADHLQIGIGLHTGPLVAGNLGSTRRMNYSVIGDTVNLAARLEGVAKAGEIIITENTRQIVRDHFKLDDRQTVMVKGKKEAIKIYNVVDRA
jgi:class 3 adenylate cyclase/PAS domain-containing protein